MYCQTWAWAAGVLALALASASVSVAALDAAEASVVTAAEARFEVLERALGPVKVVRASGSHVYAGVHRHLQVYASGSPKKLRLVHEGASLDDAVDDLAIDGTRLYLAAGQAGLQIYDIAKPAHPRLLGSLQGQGFRPRSIAVGGTYLYVASGGAGIQVVDVSVPGAPQIVSTFKQGPAAYLSVALHAPYLYATDNTRRFVVIDASNPHMLQPLGSAPLPANGQQLAVQAGLAFVADGVAGLRVLDIADPAQPHEIGHSTKVVKEDAVGLALSGSQVLLADRSVVGGEGHYVMGGLRVIDIADPRHPQELANLRGDLISVDAAGTQAHIGIYQVDHVSTIDTIDVSVPDQPKRRASTHLPIPGSDAMHARGGDVFIADLGFNRIDLTSPSKPTLAWTLPLPGHEQKQDAPYRDFIFEGTLAFVDLGQKGVSIIDLVDPDHPRRAATITQQGRPMASTGHYLYTKPYSGKLRIYDTQSPDAPVLVGSVTGSEFASFVRIAGAIMYLADLYTFQLKAFDLSDPVAPVLVNTIAIPQLFAMEVEDDLLYLGTQGLSDSRSLQLYSIASPPAVTLLGEVAIDRFSRSMAVCQKTAFFARPTMPGGGVSAVSAPDPTAPFIAAHHAIDDQFAMAVACLGNGTVAVNVREGLLVLRYTPP